MLPTSQRRSGLTPEEMYAAIGYGGASAQAGQPSGGASPPDCQQAERLAAERAEKEAEEKPRLLSPDAGVARAAQETLVSGVIVSGMTEWAVKFGCCTSCPGTPLWGSSPTWVSVHRSDCPNAVAAPSVPGRRTAGSRSAGDPDSLNTYKTSLTSLP
ncbi:MAG: hypothetical protein ACLS43_10670 [Evtepia gabavorous]